MPITFDLRQESDAGKPHVRICAGARSNLVLTATLEHECWPTESIEDLAAFS
jgi:hypothetical protein